MARYLCIICGKDYSSPERAKECRDKGFNGPKIEPGLILSSKKVKDGFKIFYKELASRGHERHYEFQEFLILGSEVSCLEHYSQSAPGFIKGLEIFKIATKEEVKKVEELIKKDFPGTGAIKKFLKSKKVKRIHNNLELKIT